jgi:hypothetical protein
MNKIPDDFRIEPFPADTDYELRISGRLAQPTLAWFEDMNVTVDGTTSPAQTVISGPIRDQAALYGLISRIRDLGLTLMSVQRLEIAEKPKNRMIMNDVSSAEFSSATDQYSLRYPADWLVEEDRENSVLVMANSEAALERFNSGEAEPGDFAIIIGFIPAAFFQRVEFEDLDIQLGTTPDAFLQSIMPMLRVTADYGERTVVSDSELVSLSDEVKAGLLTVTNEEREGMFIVFEAVEGVIAFVSAAGYPAEVVGFQEIAFDIAANIDYTGSAEDLAAAFFGD